MAYDFVCSITIDADIKRVYQIAETYPHFVRFYSVKETLLNDDCRIKVRVGYKFFGFMMTWLGDGAKEYLQSIKYKQIDGILRNMKAEWFFTPLDGKTVVELKIDLKETRWGKILGHSARKVSSEILDELKYTAEKVNR